MTGIHAAVAVALGTIVFLVTFAWERNLLERGSRAPADEALDALIRERKVLEWTRVIAAAAMLAGVLMGMWC